MCTSSGQRKYGQMGILEKIRHRMMWKWPDVGGCKESLTFVNTDEDSILTQECCLLNRIDDNQILISMDLKSPRSKLMIATPTSITSASPCSLFEDDEDDENLLKQLHERDELNLLHDFIPGSKDEDDSSSYDDERDDVRLLAPSHEDSSSSLERTTDSFDDVDEDEDPVFEASFEVELTGGIPQQGTLQEKTPKKDSAEESSYLNPLDRQLPRPIPSHICRPRPQKRYDKRGQAFLHIFHDALSTLHEEDSIIPESENKRLPYHEGAFASALTKQTSNLPPIQRARLRRQALTRQYVSEELQIQARWEHTLEVMSQMDLCNSTVVVPLNFHAPASPSELSSMMYEI